MRIARCTDSATRFWAVVDREGKTARPLAGSFADWAPAVTAGKRMTALHYAGDAIPLDALRMLPPVEKGSKIVVVGANYAKHLIEFGVAPPPQPVAFLKAYGALIGANDPIRYPPLTKQLDHEVELVAVIGAPALDRNDPLSSLLGYCVGNDVSARDLQSAGPPGIGMDLFGAKSQDRTTGLGPWIVTPDEFPTHPVFHLTLSVNGEVRQQGSTAEMTWDIASLLRFVDDRSSLECGDILFTGTPSGVGQATGRYLEIGDVVQASIDGIGTLDNIVMPAAEKRWQ